MRSEGLLCFLNRAQCYLKSQEWRRAKKDADLALGIDPESLKARFRRGLACVALEQWEGAREDLSKVVAAEPSNASAARGLKKARAACRAREMRDRETFKGAFLASSGGGGGGDGEGDDDGEEDASGDEEDAGEKEEEDAGESSKGKDGPAAAAAATTKKSKKKKIMKKKKKNAGVLLYDDKPAAKAKEDPAKPTRIIEVPVPEGKRSGETFVYALPGGVGEATIRVPEGKKGGDTLRLKVRESVLNGEPPSDDENEQPESGPIGGAGFKALKGTPTVATWLCAAAVGMALAGGALAARRVFNAVDDTEAHLRVTCLAAASAAASSSSSSSSSASSASSWWSSWLSSPSSSSGSTAAALSLSPACDGGVALLRESLPSFLVPLAAWASLDDAAVRKQLSGAVVLPGYIGVMLLVMGVVGWHDRTRGKSQMSDLWLRMAFAVTAPSSLVSALRSLTFLLAAARALLLTLLFPTLLPTPLLEDGGGGGEGTGAALAAPATLMTSLLHRDAVGSFVFTALTVPLATHLASYIGGWQSIGEELSKELTSFVHDFPTRFYNTLSGDASEWTWAASGDGSSPAPAAAAAAAAAKKSD